MTDASNIEHYIIYVQHPVRGIPYAWVCICMAIYGNAKEYVYIFFFQLKKILYIEKTR